VDAASEHNPCRRRGGRQRRYVFVKLVNMIRRKLSILAAGKISLFYDPVISRHPKFSGKILW